MKRHLTACAAALLTGVSLGGCSFGANIDTLLAPPKLSEDQEQIYAALTAAAGTSISLKYPKSGDYLSAFIIEELDGDGSAEALVFYENTDENALRINLLDQKDGAWVSLYDCAAPGAEIEEVYVSRLGDHDRVNITVGCSLVNQSERIAEVYTLEDGALRSTLRKNYSVLNLRDLNGDEAADLLLLSAQSPSKAPYAAMYRLDASGNYYESVLELSTGITDIAQVTYGVLEDGALGIYIDGTAAGSVKTQVLTVTDGVLRTVYADSADPEAPAEVLRSTGVYCMDVDDDGVIEIPLAEQFLGYEADDPDAPVLTQWHVCRGGALIPKAEGYYNAQYHYAFLLPEQWKQTVTVRLDTVRDEVVFCRWSEDVPSGEWTELLRLAVADSSGAQDRQVNDYMLLASKDELYYLAKICNPEDALALRAAEVLFEFRLVS